MAGLCLSPEYEDFRSKLKQSLLFLGGATLPTTGNHVIDAALEVLQTEREKTVKVVVKEWDDHDKMGDSIRTWATDQVKNMVNEAGQPQAPVTQVDDAFEVLVRNATEEFGFIPRDVYRGVFLLSRTRKEHAAAVRRLDCSELINLTKDFSGSCKLEGFSEKMVVVYPVPSLVGFDKWAIDFKSIRIARQAMEKMRLEEDKTLWETHQSLHKISGGSILAGWILKAIASRKLSVGWQSNKPAPQPIRMTSDNIDPPTSGRISATRQR